MSESQSDAVLHRYTVAGRRAVLQAFAAPLPDAQRLTLLRVATALTALVTLLYSAPLWQSHVLPPQVPPFGAAPPRWIDAPLFLLALAALAVMLRGRRGAAPAALAFVTVMLVLALGDQHRWQPPVQMFVVFAAGVGVYGYVAGSADRVLALLRLYVVSLYAYSGLQKLNPAFIHDFAPRLMRPVLARTGLASLEASDDGRIALGIAMALTEASLAVLLLLPRTRAVGVFLAVSMHGFLPLLLGPLGRDSNAFIWPWNAFMIVAVIALFWRARGNWLLPLRAHPLLVAGAAILVLYPAGHAAGVIDAYLAHNLYTAYPGISSVCLPHGAAGHAPPWQARLMQERQVDGERWQCVDEFGWYIDALHITPYAAPRVQAALAVAACDQLRPPDILLREWGRAALFRLDRAPLDRRYHEYRGCEAVRARAAGSLLGGAPR